MYKIFHLDWKHLRHDIYNEMKVEMLVNPLDRDLILLSIN